MKKDDVLSSATEEDVFSSPNIHRRKFLSKMGITTAIASGLAACTKTTESNLQSAESVDELKAFVAGDIAILNYAYLLEQLEATFYTIVTSNFYSGATSWEKKRFEQIRDHEIAHREFFKTALGNKAIPEVQFDFSSIDFSSRTSVLTSSKAFEDTGVSAYNGVAYALMSADYLLTAGKIVSVEARHAAYLRDLLDPLSFADITVVKAGLDVSKSPKEVVKIVAPYLKVLPDLTSFPYTL